MGRNKKPPPAPEKPKNGNKDTKIINNKISRQQLEKDANVTQKTKGKTSHGEKNGGFDQAQKDFDSLEGLENINSINTSYGPGKFGTLSDGSAVILRRSSSDGRPTIQIKNSNNRRQTEIRYNP